MSHIQNIIETGKNDFEDGDKIVFRKGSEWLSRNLVGISI